MLEYSHAKHLGVLVKHFKISVAVLILITAQVERLVCAEVEVTRTEVPLQGQNSTNVKYSMHFGTEAMIISTGMLLALPSLFAKKKALSAGEISLLNRDDISSFDRGATYNHSKTAKKVSDITVGVAVGLPALLFTLSGPRDNFWNIVVLYAESFSLTFGLTQFVKTVVDRKRPLMYNPDVSLDDKLKSDNLKSFYSSHTAMAFNGAVFFATVFSQHYPDSKLNFAVWPLSLGVASLVGYMRYKAGKHYPSDILIGAAVGSLFGVLVPVLHKKYEKSNVALMPVTGEFNGLIFMIKI
jgi:hypothetical protein